VFRYRRKTVDIVYDIQFRPSLYTRYVFDIEVFIRYRVQYRIAIPGYKDIEGKNFHVVYDISAMLGYKDIDVFSSISKIWSILGTICHTWPGGGWAHRPRSSPADGSSFLVLDPLGRSVLLGDCLDALSCWSSADAFCCCNGQALVWTALPAGHGLTKFS
jgi:hypothetical protein